MKVHIWKTALPGTPYGGNGPAMAEAWCGRHYPEEQEWSAAYDRGKATCSRCVSARIDEAVWSLSREAQVLERLRPIESRLARKARKKETR